MSLLQRMRPPVLEVVVLVGIGAILWVSVELYRLQQEMAQTLASHQEQFRETLTKQEESWRQYSLTAQDVLRTREDFKFLEALKLKEEYEAVAVHIRSSVPRLTASLQPFVEGRPNEFRQLAKDLGEWIEKRQERMESERFGAKSVELIEAMSKARAEYTNLTVSIGFNLVLLMNATQEAYSNCVAAAENAVTPASRNRADIARRYLEEATTQADLMLELAAAAQSDSEAVSALIEARQPLQLQKMPKLAESRKMLDRKPTEDRVWWLRLIMYALLGVVLVLAVALGVAFYHHFVVAPLRQELSEREAQENQQRKLDHFAKLSRELAHEIRNPLTAINARLFTLQKLVASQPGPAEDASVIQGEIKRLDRIVGQFLRLGSPAEPRLIPMSADQALRGASDLMQPGLENQSIELKLEGDGNVPFRADPQLLQQVLINLIQNAAESMEGKESQRLVTLRARQADATLGGKAKRAAILEVEDAGGGIPPDHWPRVFDPFFSTKEKGTGLGLAIAARIIERHAGALTFESTVGKGTTFRITLPLAVAT